MEITVSGNTIIFHAFANRRLSVRLFEIEFWTFLAII